MSPNVIGPLCAGLLSCKGKSSLKGFNKIYVIVYTDRIAIDLVLTKPNRKKIWDIKELNNKLEPITMVYKKKENYITYKYNETGVEYLGLNKTHTLLLETIFTWIE